MGYLFCTDCSCDITEGYYKLKRPEMEKKDEKLLLNTLINVLSDEICHRVLGSQPASLV